ncbi:Dynein heavy chain 1, axonemal [Nowakowskiella sp. JEL0078]|nr:Dynein heavy chain 1, axonemal [Nowakowskiella sp. JEL0078]
MYSHKKRYLPPGLNPSSVINTFSSPLLQGSSFEKIVDNSIGNAIGNGVFSEILTNPDLMDEVETSIKQTSIISGLTEVAVAAVADQSYKIPHARSFKRSAVLPPTSTLKPVNSPNSFQESIPLQPIPRDANKKEPTLVEAENKNILMPETIGEDELNNENDFIPKRQVDTQPKKLKRSDYCKALEPKVMLPFEARPGQTPRKIEIERRKRLFSAQKIEELLSAQTEEYKLSLAKIKIENTNQKSINFTNDPIVGKQKQETDQENVVEYKSGWMEEEKSGLMPGFPQAQFTEKLPIEFFDDTEFDSRITEDWLTMGRNQTPVNTRPTSKEKSKTGDIERAQTPSNIASSIAAGLNPQLPIKEMQIASPIKHTDIPVPAKAFLSDVWKDCVATAYDYERSLWKIRLIKFEGWDFERDAEEDFPDVVDDDKEDFDSDMEIEDPIEQERKCAQNEAWVHRINLLFLAEDPFNFGRRILAAYKLRAETAIKLRYDFYIDSMPTGESGQMPIEQFNRILDFATSNGNRFKKIIENQNIEKIMNEIKLDFARSMNRQFFDLEVKNPANQGLSKFLVLPKEEPQSPVPLRGTILNAKYDFEKNKKDFSFSSFLVKSEVIRTMSKIRVECYKLNTSNLYSTSINKNVRLDEFEQMQNQSLQNMKNFLKDRQDYFKFIKKVYLKPLKSWISSLKTMLKNGFKDVGKGWYNMQETNPEVYKISKLKKFMTATKFMMQDSLRFLIINSLSEYIKLIGNISCQRVIVKGTNDVKIVETNAKEKVISELNAKRPLFLIDLIFRNGKVMYNVDPASFEQVILSIFDKAMTIVEGLPQLEPIVLDQMFWATKPTLQIPHNKERPILILREALKQAIRDGITPLEQYVKTYDKHLKILNLDITQYAQDYENENLLIEDMERDIVKHIQDWEALDKDIPSHIGLGLFWVSCESIRAAMRKDLSKVVLEILSKKTSRITQSISNAFSQIQQKLKNRPLKIEELTELREFMKTIPETCRVQNGKIQEMLHNYDILEKYKFEHSNEDFKARWSAYGWPMKVEEMVRTTEVSLEVDEASFMRNLVSDQEVFRDRVNQISSVIADFSHHTDLSRIAEIVSEIAKITMELKECQNLVSLFNSRERLFNLEVTHYDEVAQLVKEFEPYRSLWQTSNDWIKWKNAWLHGSFLDLNAEEVEKNLMNAWRVMFKSVKHFKQIPGCLHVATQIKDEMEDFKPFVPLIQSLRNPGMRDRHWDRLSDELGMQIRPDEKFTLTDFLDMKLMEKVDVITKVCDVAGKEYAIEAALDKMDAEWKNITMEIIVYKDSGTYIMRTSDEIIRLLDDHIVMTQSMSFSPFKKPFAERISLWESKLRTVQEVLEAWMMCQRTWLYLEPIFSSDDIITQLPVESKRFSTMDRTWRRIMSQAKTKPGVLECCADYKLLDSFRECNKLLELVSKGLSAYLESKRISFPRFFFLSDDELLQILSQTKDPTAVQPHLRKCFENIASLEFQEDRKITAMFSGEGERVPLAEPFYPKGPVEDWLQKVEDQMRKSIRKVIMDGLACYHLKQRTQWVLDWPGQVVLSVSQTYWTKEVHEALKTGQSGLKGLYQRQLLQLQGLVSLVRGELPFLSRLVLGDLIVIDVHSRDVVKNLIDGNVISENDFLWISQLRYYWEDDDLRVKIVNANFRYGGEYLGNTGRLVITPLTDRCYLTLTGAMHLGMGGAPAGPAGTGKTETTKDLAKALAKQCVVFNCSDQLDYLAMAKFFKGLASSGAWACFDEFNRVLSVIAQQITTIQKAVLAGQTRFMFEGVELPLDPTNAIFITMNPGYAGET